VRLLFYTKPTEALLKLEGLAEFLGIRVERIDVAMAGSLELATRKAISATERAIVLDVASLENKFDEEELRALAGSFARHDIAVLLLVSHSDEASALMARLLTSNAISGLTSAGQVSRVSFPANSAMLSGELSSYSYSRKPGKASCLITSAGDNSQVVMMLDWAPTFVCVSLGRARIFVWVTDAVFDVFRPLAAEIEFEQAADQYIPAIIFLRFAFGQQCWHNPSPGAGIVIDDPLLRKSYGFIKFPQLLESARRHKYHITLAFIPWNHWRSRAKEVQMFLNYSDCFSVCAHGCDHTNHEFRSTDYEELLRRNFIASRRMDRHRERTGLASEPLMVCPQEQYSLEAMRAFADSRQFIGLVCTACMPRNLASPQLRGADLLLPAQDSFFGFPVFKRHYWRDMSVFAMALFLGKPAILVEHHEFFRKGPEGVDAFVSALSKLRPDMKWTSLVETVTQTHLRRQVSEGKYELRFFTDKFKLEHESVAPAEYRLIRRIPADTVVSRITVNGEKTSFIREGGLLSFEVRSDQPQTIHVELEVPPVRPTSACSSGIGYEASVALRRGLSEFRDNVLVRNRFALRTSRLLARALKQTGS
jgi:hypothetical protein